MTGASEGIGRALAHALAATGHAVTGVARNEDLVHPRVRPHGESECRTTVPTYPLASCRLTRL
ncbi:hypothetical protein [Nocardia fluminea]|uniref:hypothetical protein n=1 Tax=Nocardia fluminea TaxID=134984 RepID=UPI003F4DCDA1